MPTTYFGQLRKVDEDFMQPVEIAIVTEAIALLNTVGTSAQLASYCNSILASPRSYAQTIAIGCVADPALTLTDAAIQTRVHLILPRYAGIVAT